MPALLYITVYSTKLLFFDRRREKDDKWSMQGQKGSSSRRNIKFSYYWWRTGVSSLILKFSFFFKLFISCHCHSIVIINKHLQMFISVQIVDLVKNTMTDTNTKLAIFDHIPSNTPFIFPVKKICDLCHERWGSACTIYKMILSFGISILSKTFNLVVHIANTFQKHMLKPIQDAVNQHTFVDVCGSYT